MCLVCLADSCSYWNLADDANMRDVLLAVRADESNHRDVNHVLAGVDSHSRSPI